MLHVIFDGVDRIMNLSSEIVTKWPVIPCQGQKFNCKTRKVIHLKGKHARFFMY